MGHAETPREHYDLTCRAKAMIVMVDINRHNQDNLQKLMDYVASKCKAFGALITDEEINKTGPELSGCIDGITVAYFESNLTFAQNKTLRKRYCD